MHRHGISSAVLRRWLVVGAVLCVIVVVVGCGAAARGRVARVRGAPAKWEIWIPPLERSVYVRFPEPVAVDLLTPACPGTPWGMVQRYRFDARGHIIYRRGEPAQTYTPALERAVKEAHAGAKPGWMKAYETKCRGR